MTRSRVRAVVRRIRKAVSWQLLPSPAKAECRADYNGLPAHDPGIQRTLQEGLAWLGRAQDCSASHDGGVARHFSLIDGWASSYPETTGYIIPTLLAYARANHDEVVRKRARTMLEWLTSIQFVEGGFQGGRVDERPRVPVSFNTGQILLGLAAGVTEFGDHHEALLRAADWLVSAQDADGAWRKYPSPFVAPGEKTYDTHIAWGLLEAARVAPHKPYAEAALANVRWALSFQRENGWLDKCCLTDSTQPLTHTIGYALRGVVEAYRFSRDASFLDASRRTADALVNVMGPVGFIPGRLNQNWEATVPWACLTGTAQIAACLLLLYRFTGETRYLVSGSAASSYVRGTVRVDGPPEVRGAVKGSFPISGDYGRYLFPNWACKFLMDANMLESELTASSRIEQTHLALG